jgi:localization factor PodJL
MYDAPPPFPENDFHAAQFQTAEQFAHMGNGAAGATMPSFDAPPGFVPDQPFAGAGDAFSLDPFQNQSSSDESYLAAMRRQARAASAAAETGKGKSGFTWGTSEKEPSAPGKTRYLLLIVIALIAAVAVLAGVFLSQHIAQPAHNDSALFPKNAPAAVKPVTNILGPDQAASNTDAGQSNAAPAVPPLEEKTVRNSPVNAVPTGSPRVPAATSAPAKPVATLDKLTQLANAGNATAELVVGLKYLDGDGVPVNEGEAAKWLQRAAEKGEPMAQYRLGTLYERGKGVAADQAKAVRWYQAAAQQGNRKAMHNLAVAYAEGSGQPKNFAEAARWFSKAAALGLSDSQFNLAVLYERGLGVPQSLLDAYKWYWIAANQGGDAESKNRIGALATQLSPADKAAAERAASSFKPTALNGRANVAPTINDVVK